MPPSSLSIDPLLAAWAVFALSTLSPGPATLATIAAAMGEGRAAGLLVGLGVTFGSLTWGLAAALGVTAILLALPGALPVLHAAGGAWLCWLAVKAGRSAASPVGPVLRPARAAHPFLRGYLIHLLNPNAPLGWAAVVLVGLGAGGATMQAAATLGGAALIALGFYGACALAFSSAGVSATYRRARRGIDTALAVTLGVAGLSLLAAASRSLMPGDAP